MPSNAYRTFQKNLGQVDRLLETYDHELARDYRRGKKSLDHLTRAGLIFLCSSFEVYIESVVRECGQFVTKKIQLPKSLPEDVKKNISVSVKMEKHELSPILFYDDWKTYYNNMIIYETKHLNTPKVANIRKLLLGYFGIQESEINDSIFPFSDLDEIITARGDVAHNIFGEKYLKKAMLLEYMDTIKYCVNDIDNLLYNRIPDITKYRPWKNTYENH